MQILQTIWTALTTENEILISIIRIPFVFIEIYLEMLLFHSFFNITSSTKNKILYVFSISTISIIFSTFIPNPYYSIINLFLLPLFIWFFFKTNFIKSIFSSILPMVIIVILESVYIKFFYFVFNINLNSITLIPIYRLSITIIIYISIFIIYKLIKSFHIILNILDNINTSTKIIIIINVCFGIITILIQFYLVGFYLKSLSALITILSLISLIGYFILSLFTFTRITKLELTKIDLEQQREHNRILKLAQDDLHGFRHDFANIMCTIGGYVQAKDMKGLSIYYSEIQKDIQKVNNLSSLDPQVINHPAIFTLIASKYDKASELGITMNINCFLDLNKLNMKIYEFTRILGILLDNAIEASKECEDKTINLEIRKDTSRNRQILLIENTYKNKEIDTEKIYEKNYSTKDGNTGLGLWEVRQILKKNNNLNLFTSKDDTYFKQQLEMYNN